MPEGMGNGKEGRLFPKMQVYSEFEYDKVVELIHVNSPAFSQATIRGVLDTFGVVLKNYLPLGHTMKIDNVGSFACRDLKFYITCNFLSHNGHLPK